MLTYFWIVNPDISDGNYNYLIFMIMIAVTMSKFRNTVKVIHKYIRIKLFTSLLVNANQIITK